jgi:hypothetical protein
VWTETSKTVSQKEPFSLQVNYLRCFLQFWKADEHTTILEELTLTIMYSHLRKFNKYLNLLVFEPNSARLYIYPAELGVSARCPESDLHSSESGFPCPYKKTFPLRLNSYFLSAPCFINPSPSWLQDPVTRYEFLKSNCKIEYIWEIITLELRIHVIVFL